MLSGIEVYIENSKNLSSKVGTLLHGYMMDMIDYEYASRLHEQGLKPYNQYIFFDKNKQCFIWRIMACDEECDENLICKIENRLEDKIFLSTKKEAFVVNGVNRLKAISYKELLDKFFIEENKINRKIKLNFITPTTFKSNGMYQIFPSSDLIIKSLFNKWNNFSGKYAFKDDNVLEIILNKSNIYSYNLRSIYYPVDRTKIKSFIGKVGIVTSSPEAISRIVILLLNFSKYSGVGAKTSLGMGGVDIVE